MSFFEKSLNTLELNEVLQMLASEAVSDSAKEQCLLITPFISSQEVKAKLDETSAACSMMTIKGSPSFSGIKDIRPSLDRAVLGGSLNTRELIDISNVLKCARLVKSYIADDKLSSTCIDFLFNTLRSNKYIEEKISTSIISEDEISDSASSDLLDIRRKMRAASARARESLQKIISSPSYSKALQENLITMRAGRYVVPVKAECKGDIPGLVHDVSSSGATLFVEPMGAVKANNELRELASKEKLEIERILAELSAECAQHSEDISSDYSVLIRLDIIFAKAKLSYKLECTAASIDKYILLKRARHPLLNKNTAVPIDVELGNDYDTIIITGPNTGGKTVSLKTIGLLAAMNQCGLHIPASDGTVLPVFDNILADIGDEQSIEQSLSTFSAHMNNIVSIIDCCTENSLVLFDELGAGTDPVEGAALAVAIIDKVRSKGAYIAATTHYTELKVYATNEDRVQNASCEFDVETLKPTYRLLIGIPGKSNAFAIAKRIGLEEDIIEDAKNHIGTSSKSLENTIEKLENVRAKLESDRIETLKKLNEAAEKEKKASMLKAEHEIRLEKAELKAKREAESILKEARETAEHVFAELDEMRSQINEEQDAARINEARNDLRRKLNLAADAVRDKKTEIDTRVSSRKVTVGDMVEVKSNGLKGEVLNEDNGLLHLKCGSMNLTVKENDVYLLEGAKNKVSKNTSGSTTVLHTAGIGREIDIRGMDSVEGVMTVERYIDSAVMNRLETVQIIHGKGTGALRSAVHKMLKTNKNVKSFRLGTFGEGESGVTIVNIK